MAVKTNFSKSDFDQILSNYDLGTYKESEPISEGTVQTNFLLNTTEGKFVFRYYENRSKESALFETDLIRYLKEKNYPCPTPMKNKHKELVGVFNGKPYVILEFMEGGPVGNPGNDQKNQLIKMVAELQNITKDYKPKYTEFRWNYNIELCRELARKEAGKLNTSSSRAKLKWYEDELSKIELPDFLPKGICHCDFHFSNVLFKDGKFNALIDFDDANYTYLSYDLASLINPFKFGFDWSTWNQFGKDDDIFDFSEVKKTVSEYMKYRQLAEEEKKHLFDVYKLSIMLDCIWYFERGNADDFYERREIEYLNRLGRDEFYRKTFEE